MSCGCIIIFELGYSLSQSSDSAAMFPGRFPNIPDAMWQFGWNPAAMSFPNQFGSGEMMHQPSQAQSQAQNQLEQMQMAQLKEQNSMLKQQLASQAQTHIQHLNQLLPVHQPPSTAPSQQPPPHPLAQAPEPSPSAPLPQNPPVQTNFDTAELLKQMKETMVSTMKEQVAEQNQEPSASVPSMNPDYPPIPASSHPLPAPAFPPPVPPSSPRRRSRSHRPRSSSRKPDKRPISIHRSPLQRRSQRDRSSRPKSSSRRRRRSISRHRSPGTSVTLRSTSPRRREYHAHWHQESSRPHSPHTTAHLQPASWQLRESTYSSSTSTYPSTYPSHSDDPPQQYSKWKPWAKWTDWNKSYDSSHSTGQWKDYKKSYDRSTSAGQWIDYSQTSHPDTTHYDDSTRPIAAFSSDRFNSHQQSQRHSHRSSSVQSRKSTIPPGHVPLDLHGGYAERWVANVKFALNHPDRMRAANEIPPKERPVTTKSIDEEEFAKAVAELRSVDERIPTEMVENAVKLLFSTNLLPDYDLSTCYTMDLHSANMIALIMPLPDTSKFQMPPPFGNSKNFTWALLHGTTPSGAQQILLEGKIRPANWTQHKDLRRCDLPTFGAFYLGRQVANNDLTIPRLAQQELLCSADKKGKGQQDFVFGAMYHGAYEHISFHAGGNEKAMLRVADIGVVTTSEKYTIANSHNVGLKFVAMKWENLTVRPNQVVRRPERGASSEDDCRYRSIQERHHRQRR